MKPHPSEQDELQEELDMMQEEADHYVLHSNLESLAYAETGKERGEVVTEMRRMTQRISKKITPVR